MSTSSIIQSSKLINSAKQHVIGLAGHVDHGKTALIHAMTGIMTARSFEQACGMTQNLGFAHFTGTHGEQIGVIDVPGHERYIRNMVSGLWSIELVVLAVAANEGWMPMTQAHLEVAKAMGNATIIICITKKDLVNESQLALLEEELLERVMDACDEVPDIISVSSHTGENIEQLKALIGHVLSTQSPMAANEVGGEDLLVTQADKALDNSDMHLYVDRSFSVSGIGTVITGSLVGGEIRVGDKLTLMPKGQVVKVRSLQVYHHAVQSAAHTSRVAVGVKGVNCNTISRGDCLVADANKYRSTHNIIVRLSHVKTQLRNCQLELAIGSWHGTGQLIKITGTSLARIKLDRPVTCYFAQPVALIQYGGSQLLASCICLWLDEVPRWQRKSLYGLLDNLPQSLHWQHLTLLKLQLGGAISKEQAQSLPEGVSCIVSGDWVMSASWYQQTSGLILSLLNSPTAAMATSELASRIGGNITAIAQVLSKLKSQNLIHVSYGVWVAGSGASEDDLCHESQDMLAQIRQANRAGFSLDKQAKGNSKKLLKNLSRLKYVTQIEENIYYDSQLYQTLVGDVLSGCKKMDRLSMNDIKLRSQLSRKYAIPLANKMERDGWVRRDENDRIVIKPLA